MCIYMLQKLACLRLEILDAHPLVCGENAPGKRPHIRVVPGIVLGHHLPEPAVITLGCSLERLMRP